MTVLSLAEAKLHLKVDGDDEDSLIGGAIAAAVDHVERFTGLVLEPRAVELPVEGFGARLRAWPIASVDSVTYADGSGADQVLDASSWSANLRSRPVRLFPRASSWPALGAGTSPVTVSVQAGFAPGAVPPGIIAAVKLIVGHLYRNREAVITGTISTPLPMTVDMLLSPHRLWEV